MKNIFLSFLVCIFFFSCTDIEDTPDHIEPTEKRFFLHSDFMFGNKMIQNFFSDGESLTVATPLSIDYYKNGSRSNFYGAYMPLGFNPSLQYFINKDWAIAPYEMLNGLVIYQKATSRLVPIFTNKDFPNSPFNFLAINNTHPTYAINGNNLLFAVHDITLRSGQLIFADLDVLTSNLGGALYLDPYSQPIKSYHTLDFEKALNIKEINVRSIFNLNDSFLVHASIWGSDGKDVIFIVNSSGEIVKNESLSSKGITHVVDITSNKEGDVFILGKEYNYSPIHRIVKLNNGNLEQIEPLVDIHITLGSKFRIINDQIVIFNNSFPFIQHLDFEDQKIKVVDTKELGFLTYRDIIEHHGKTYLGTNNGLFYIDVDKFWQYMDPMDFLESGLYPDYPSAEAEVLFH